MIDLKFRAGIARITEPLGRALLRSGLTANRLTVLGVALAAVASWEVSIAHLFLAGTIGTVACLFDLLDGPTAKAAGSPSRRGGFLDSVADRLSESMMYFGLTYYCLHHRSSRVALAVLVAYMAAQITSYARAKADALEIDGKVGFMERAERQITLGLAVLIPHALTPLLVFLAVASSVTAFQRMIVIWLRLSQADSAPGPVGPAATPRSVSLPRERWERWRAAHGRRLVRR
jgi:phosphatidylinositol phosphate synthase